MLCGDLNGNNKGDMYMYSPFTSLYSRNQYNIVKQLYASKKKKKKKIVLYISAMEVAVFIGRKLG